MAKTMLIDATHPEETRVAVVDGKKLEEFDVEIAGRRPLKGNIYLAKVTRVEPSLQACFVEYGGNRHGFLAFSEIHPDYYRIPVADREALMRETQEALDSDHDHDGERRDNRRDGGRDGERGGGRDGGRRRRSRRHEDHGAARAEAQDDADHGHDEGHDHGHDHHDHAHDDQHHDHDHDHDHDEGAAESFEAGGVFESDRPGPLLDAPADLNAETGQSDEAAMPLHAHQDVLRGPLPDADQSETESAPADAAIEGFAAAENAGDFHADPDLPPPSQAELVEVPVSDEVFDTVGGAEPAPNDDPEVDEENARRRRQRALRRYKIQEVIKRRQILLVQVTKEERGNKGAALTTYLSLAGRYCVLMPNTDRGGGISRRITSLNDRKRLKSIVDDLDVPEGMAVIVRTAGSERSKAEVKRDFEYLMRLWDEIRDITLKSTAPALIYEEASLIKRSIRDVYTREMGDIVVAGVEAYQQAKSFMRMLTPSHAKRVQLHRDTTTPLFQRYQVESQLAAIHNPTVHLRSGGYIVINQTEALVAIDVNSGRSTKERNIEETALKTNLEAAEEVARQLRLRDLAGLIVIDFIDMEEGRNNSAVERRLKDALRNDRARIQIGRISSFGLLEMSRQRLHPSLQEASTDICPHCRGSGRIRSVDSTALHVLRLVEEEITRSFSPGVSVYAPTAVALYILNQKRVALSQLEMRRGVRIYINGDDSLTPPDYRLERIKQLAPGEELPPAPPPAPLPADAELDLEDDIVEEVEDEADEAAEADAEAGAEGTAQEGATQGEGADDEQGGRGRGRGRRRRRRGRGNRFSADEFTESAEKTGDPADAGAVAGAVAGAAPAVEAGGDSFRTPVTDNDGETGEVAGVDDGEDEGDEGAATAEAGEDGDGSRRRRRRGRRGGRRRSRRGQEGGAEGAGEDSAAAEGSAETATMSAGDGDQPAVPEDGESLPPQWRHPAAPAHAQPTYSEPLPAVAPAAELSAPPAPEPTTAPSLGQTAAQAEAEPAKPAAASTPVTVIEVGTAGESEAGNAGQRRGWWRRLIE